MPSSTAAGVGLKPPHYAEAHACSTAGARPELWFEVHPENYMTAGGPRLAWLETIRRDAAVSLHGVGLSLAGPDRPDRDHLDRLKRLADRFQPFVMSEHLAWCRDGTAYHPDLLPFPRTTAMLDHVAANVVEAQDVLGRRLLIENPSLYLAIEGHDLGEVEFLADLSARTGCGLLVDVNNVFVSARNLGFDALAYLDALPGSAIGEIHVAGHAPDPDLGESLLIDTHGASVSEAVWALHAHLIGRIGPRPTLVERDDDLPPFADLLAEADRAATALARVAAPVSVDA